MKIKFIKDFVATQSDDFRDLHAILIKRGDIVDVDGCKYNDSYFDMPKEQAQWLIDNGFAEEVKESGWWKPTRGDNYYFINGAGVITSTVWMDSSQDRVRYLMGNCFRTTEAADRFANYLNAVATVRQDEGVLTPEQAAENRYNYYICTHNEFGPVVHGFNADYVSVNTVLFDTREHAQASRDKHQDEWEIIANYDWSRE